MDDWELAMKESDIIYERGDYWVGRTHKPASYTVYRMCLPCFVSEPDSSYALDGDGLSLAKARADYLYRRSREKLCTN